MLSKERKILKVSIYIIERREAWSGDPRKRRWRVQSSAGSDNDVDSGSESERPMKIKVISDKQSSRRDGRDIYILQVTFEYEHVKCMKFDV